jgi:hypothetical protein
MPFLALAIHACLPRFPVIVREVRSKSTKFPRLQQCSSSTNSNDDDDVDYARKPALIGPH